jgi:hypothetical protein
LTPDWVSDFWNDPYGIVVDLTPKWVSEWWNEAKSMIVSLIPSWGSTPEPPAPPESVIPRYRTQRAGGNATGDPMWHGGWTMVGERGPEMVRLPRNSRIYNDQQTAGMMGSTTVNNYNTLSQPHDIELLAQRVAAQIGRKAR